MPAPESGLDHRIECDFEVTFENGGSLAAKGFRLDIPGADITDDALADYIVRDLRLLLVAGVRVERKRIIVEPHKRPATPRKRRPFVDLSHTVTNGLVTYRGLPPPVISDHLGRVQSRPQYAPDTEFQIGRIDMVGNTGTYLDSPFHRFADGADLAALELESLAALDGLAVRVPSGARAIHRSGLSGLEVADKAVLLHTGWDRHWGGDEYFEGHPFLTEDAAQYLMRAGAALVGIDSMNIDDTGDSRRPVHTILLGAGIPIVEHLCRLESLPDDGFRFFAVPAKIRGLGTFPIRAFAIVEPRHVTVPTRRTIHGDRR